MRSLKASPIATIFTPLADSSTLRIAPVPRPPQPMTPTRISSLPAAYAPGSEKWVATVVPTAAAVAVLMKLRRENPWSF